MNLKVIHKITYRPVLPFIMIFADPDISKRRARIKTSGSKGLEKLICALNYFFQCSAKKIQFSKLVTDERGTPPSQECVPVKVHVPLP